MNNEKLIIKANKGNIKAIKDLANSKAPDMSSVVFADESKLPYSLDKDLKFTLRHLNKDSLQKVFTIHDIQHTSVRETVSLI